MSELGSCLQGLPHARCAAAYCTLNLCTWSQPPRVGWRSIKRLLASNITASTDIALHMLAPWIEFCFTSWQQSSSVYSGMSSSVVPSGSRRYTWADDRSSTWNLGRRIEVCFVSGGEGVVLLHLAAA